MSNEKKTTSKEIRKTEITYAKKDTENVIQVEPRTFISASPSSQQEGLFSAPKLTPNDASQAKQAVKKKSVLRSVFLSVLIFISREKA